MQTNNTLKQKEAQSACAESTNKGVNHCPPSGECKEPHPSPLKHSLTLKGSAKNTTLHPSNTPWPWGECKEPHPLPLTPSTLPDLEGEYKEPRPPPLEHSLTKSGMQRPPPSTPSSGGVQRTPYPHQDSPTYWVCVGWGWEGGGRGCAKAPNSTQHKLTNPVESLPHRHTVCCSPALQRRTEQLWAGSWWVPMSLYT